MPHVISRPGVVHGTTMAVFLALVHAVNDFVTASIGALLPTLQARFAASTTTLAILVAVYSVSSSATQPFLGALADRWGLRRVAGAGVALAAAALSLLGVASSIWLLVALLLLGGIGSAALHPVATAIVGGATSKNPSLAVGLFTAGGMVGFGIGPVLILYLVSRHGTDITPWLMLPGLALAVGIMTLLPEWEPHSRPRLTRLIDRRSFGRTIRPLTAATVLISLAFITFTSAVPLWLVEEHQLSTDDALLGWLLGVFAAAAAVGAVAGGAIGARLGYATTTFTSLILAMPAMVAVLVLPPGAAMLTAAAVAGVLLYASQPLLVVAAQNAVPDAPAAAAGVVLGVSNAIAGVLYIAVGALQGILGLTPAMLLAFALVIPAALLARNALRSTD